MDAIQDVTWAPSKTGLAALLIERGKNLTPPFHRPQLGMNLSEQEFSEQIEVRELRNRKTAEQHLVGEFYKLWTGTAQKPAAKEVALAREIIEQHGDTRAKAIICEAVKLMKARWPDAKTFGAVSKYLDEALREVQRQEHHRNSEQQESESDAKDRADRERRAIETLKFKPLWNTLEEAARDQFRQRVVTRNPHMARFPKLVERFALTEFARSRGAKIDVESEAA